MIEKLYTVEEVAELASVTGRTIRNYLKSGRLVGRKIGGQWRFPESEVQRLLTGADVSELLDEALFDVEDTAAPLPEPVADTRFPSAEPALAAASSSHEKYQQNVEYVAPAPLPIPEPPSEAVSFGGVPPYRPETAVASSPSGPTKPPMFTQPRYREAQPPPMQNTAPARFPAVSEPPASTFSVDTSSYYSAPEEILSAPPLQDWAQRQPPVAAPTQAAPPNPPQVPAARAAVPIQPEPSFQPSAPPPYAEPSHRPRPTSATPLAPQPYRVSPDPYMNDGYSYDYDARLEPQPAASVSVQPPAPLEPAQREISPSAHTDVPPGTGYNPPQPMPQNLYGLAPQPMAYQNINIPTAYSMPLYGQSMPQSSYPSIVLPYYPVGYPVPSNQQPEEAAPPEPSAKKPPKALEEPKNNANFNREADENDYPPPTHKPSVTEEHSLSEVGQRVTKFISEVHDCSNGPLACTVVDLYQSLSTAKKTSQHLADIAQQETDAGVVCKSFVEYDERYSVARYTLFGSSAFLFRCINLLG